MLSSKSLTETGQSVAPGGLRSGNAITQIPSRELLLFFASDDAVGPLLEHSVLVESSDLLARQVADACFDNLFNGVYLFHVLWSIDHDPAGICSLVLAGDSRGAVLTFLTE